MDQLEAFLGFKSLQELQIQLAPFVIKYNAPGALNPTSALDYANIMTLVTKLLAAVQTITLDENMSLDSLCPIIEQLSSVFALLKMFSRFGATSIESCYIHTHLDKLLEIYATSNKIYTNIMCQQQSTTCTQQYDSSLPITTQTIISLLTLRLELARLFQNMSIQNPKGFRDTILSQQSTTQHLLNIISTCYLSSTTFNQSMFETIFTTSTKLSLSQVLGLFDLDHVLRCVSYIVSQDQEGVFASYGLLQTLYTLFLTITSTKVTPNQTISTCSCTQPCYSPYLFHSTPYKLTSLTTVKSIGDNHNAPNQHALDNEALHIAFRTTLNDIPRIILIFGSINDDENYILYFAPKCGGIITEDNTTNITLFQRFVERIFYILGTGIDTKAIPEPISSPVNQILTHQDVFNEYVIKIDDNNIIGYQSSQQSYIEQFTTELNQTTVKKVDLCIPTTPIIYQDPISFIYVKMCLIKVLCRLPLQLCPFLFIHQHALTFIWELFQCGIESMIPSKEPNEAQIIPQDAVPEQYQITEIIPSIELLMNILTAARTIETKAQETMTMEQAKYYFTLGLTPLADIVKKLFYGKFADKQVDDEYRGVIIAKMMAEDIAEQKAKGLLPETENTTTKTTTTNDDDECDDFEAFADEQEATTQESTQQPTQQPTEEQQTTPTTTEDDEPMDFKQFLKALPKTPQAQQYNTQMIPAGGDSEMLLDNVQNTSIKAKTLLLMLSGHYKVGLLTQELMYKVAGENSEEFIRLCGFGRAVGLLAGKGLPGFAHLAQNAIDLNSLMGK